MNSLTFASGIKRLLNDNTNLNSLLIVKIDHFDLDTGFIPFKKRYFIDLAPVPKYGLKGLSIHGFK